MCFAMALFSLFILTAFLPEKFIDMISRRLVLNQTLHDLIISFAIHLSGWHGTCDSKFTVDSIN